MKKTLAVLAIAATTLTLSVAPAVAAPAGDTQNEINKPIRRF